MKVTLIALAVRAALYQIAEAQRMERRTAYHDGVDAALRFGRYEDATDTPACPYADGTQEADRWHDGFGDGTEDLIAYQRSGADE